MRVVHVLFIVFCYFMIDVVLVIGTILPWIAWNLISAVFRTLGSLKDSFTCYSWYSTYASYINSYHALTMILNHRGHTEASSFKDRFLKKSRHCHQFCHHIAIYSFRNLFICFAFCYFFYIKDARSFPSPILHHEL